jgi:hypothetical protein
MAHPDLAAEQAYVDDAYACLEPMRSIVERAAGAADGEVAALALEASSSTTSSWSSPRRSSRRADCASCTWR